MKRQLLSGTVTLVVDHDTTCDGTLTASFEKPYASPLGLRLELSLTCDRCTDVQLLLVKSTIAQRDPP